MFKYEEYIREKSDKLSKKEEIIKIINDFKNNISSMIELYLYRIIYNKNNKDINIFEAKDNIYNLESLNNFKDYFNNYKSLDENKEKGNSIINLLNEKNNESLNEKEYPFNEFFYYSDYIDENYLSSIIDSNNQDYPVLAKYLELWKDGNILDDFFTYNMALNSLNEEYSTKISEELAKKETLEQQLIYKDNTKLFKKFFEIYKKLSDNDDSYDNDNDNNNINLNEKLPLNKFFITEENEFSEKYKNIYNQFIEKQNEIVGKLLESKL